jgi:hypothetical protein
LFFPSFVSADVVINEFSSNSNTEWVELYNTDSTPVDLTGWTLKDEAQSPKTLTEIISGNGYFVYENSSGWLNNSGGDSIILKDDSDITINFVEYGKSGSVVGTPASDKSAGRVPDGSSDWENNLDWTKDVSNPSELTPDPTATNTSTPTPSKATYKINEVKDEDGNTLSSVKVYVDGNYVHHYAPETIEFCDGCDCDGHASCGFGSHEIMLEKSGYEDWTETRSFNSGDNVEANPQMNSVSSPTNTPKPTIVPTNKPTPKPTKKTTASDEKSDESISFTNDGNVLGTSDRIMDLRGRLKSLGKESMNDEEGGENGSGFPVAAGLLIAGGLSFIGAASYPVWRKNKWIGKKLSGFNNWMRR